MYNSGIGSRLSKSTP